MLIKLKKLDYSGNYAYAPPTKEVLTGTNLIRTVEPIETRCVEPCVSITFLDGVKWSCIGTVSEILALIEQAEEKENV